MFGEWGDEAVAITQASSNGGVSATWDTSEPDKNEDHKK